MRLFSATSLTLGSENGMQSVSLLARTELHHSFLFHIFNQTLQNLPPQPGTRHLPTTEENRGFDLVALFKKTQHVVFLGFIVVVVHVDAEFYLFYRDRLLVLLGLSLFLFLLIEILAVVHDATYGGLRRR